MLEFPQVVLCPSCTNSCGPDMTAGDGALLPYAMQLYERVAVAYQRLLGRVGHSLYEAVVNLSLFLVAARMRLLLAVHADVCHSFVAAGCGLAH